MISITEFWCLLSSNAQEKQMLEMTVKQYGISFLCKNQGSIFRDG